MRVSTLATLLFAAAAAAAPPALRSPFRRGLGLRQAQPPDCAGLEEYCMNCAPGDFDCETDPACEACEETGAFGDGGGDDDQ
ncbi:hypothetical protein GGR56DRAFT_676559 [Xylariaceae sp. FL0804]|nr:hypothetical protein GGR56DRAFT_676559 [Xylariaceae sp. FL0804]